MLVMYKQGGGNVDKGELVETLYVGYRDSLRRYLAWCKAFRRGIFPLSPVTSVGSYENNVTDAIGQTM